MMENKHSDEINTLSSQVLEYYRKYSQDQKLSTYFRGSASKSNDESTANIPSDEIINSENVNGSNTLTEQEMSRPPLVGEDNELEVDNIDCVKVSSPTSSVASNRKLEWDNGADIGYDNYGKNILHKSLSLPILTTVEHMQLQNVLRLNAEENDSEEIAQIISTVSSSEKNTSTKSSLKNHSSSSLEIVHQNVEIDSSSSSFIKPSENVTDSESSGQIGKNNTSILNLVKKVGLPIAESTPIYVISDKNVPCQFDQLDCTPLVKKLKSVSNDGIKFENSLSSDSAKSTLKDTDTATAPTNLNIKENVELFQNEIKKLKQFELTSEQEKSRNKNQKLVLLCITKPLSVECVQYKDVKDKDMQTTLCSKVSIGIQTVNPFSINCKENSQYEERQSVIFIKRSDSDSEPNTRSLGTNTNCNSFEYLYGEQFDNLKQSNANNHTNQSKLSTDVSSTCYERNSIATNLKRSQVKSDLTALGSGSEENVTSNSSPLGNLIASKQSNNLIPDIDKSIDLLQKLLKSKKYDKVTKQYYLEKIIKKILNSTYNSDSSVTSVNDVLVDYTVKGLQENHCDVVDIKALSERNLQDNLPWIPGTISNNLRLQSNEKRNRKLEVRTFSAEIIPNHQRNLDTEIMQHTTSKLKNPFTLTGDNCEDLYRKNANSNYDKFILSQSTTPSTLETSDAEVQKFQDWKNDKTLSEKLFEQRRINTIDKSRGDGQLSSTSDSDVIVNFAKKERQNQLHWISSEITHLNKLKSLLQKKNDKKLQIDILTKPHNEMGEPKKSTSVYVITTETSGDSKSSNKEVSSKFHYNSNLESLKSNYAHKVNKKYKSKDKIPCTDTTCPHQTKTCKCASVTQKNNTQMKIDETIVIDENNSPKVKNAKLISKEIYNHGQPNTCIRRYVFEIPVECKDDEFRNVQKLQKDDSVSLHLDNYKKTNQTNDVRLNQNKEAVTSDLELHDKIQDNFDIDNRQKLSVSSVHSPATNPEERKPGFSKNGREKDSSDDISMDTDDELLKSRIQKKDKITSRTQEDFVRLSERNQQKQLKRNGLKEVEVKTRSQEDFDCVSETRHQKQPTKETDDDRPHRYESRDKEINKKGLKEVEVKTRLQEEFDRVSETRHQKRPTKETDDDRVHRYESRDKEINKKGLKEVEVKTSSQEDFDRVSETKHKKQPTKETDDDRVHRYESRDKEINKKGLKQVEVKTRSQEDFDRVSETRHQKRPTKETDDDRAHRYELRDKGIKKNGLKKIDVKTRSQEDFNRVSETKHKKQPTKETNDDRAHRYELRDEQSTTSSEMPIDEDNNERYVDSKLSKKEIASDSETSTDTARKRQKNALNLNNKNKKSQKITKKESSEDKLKKISSNNKSEDGNITEKAQENLDSNSNKRTQTDKKSKNDVFSSSSSSSTESTSSDSSESYCTGVCPCCKQNEASKRVRNIATSLQTNIQRALCQPCYVQSQQTNWPHSKPYYTYPGHVCNCYTLIKTDTVNEIQRTVEELDRLENDYCTCRYNKSKICNCTRGTKQKKSIGYTLTFENGNPESEEDIKGNRSLEEIKIRIPYREKTNKDYESRKRHKKKHSNKSKSGKENSQDSIKHKHSHKKDKKSKHVTLQDYLCLNRPNFIETAEQRRKCMVDLAYLREQRCQKYKQLLAMTNGVCLNNDNMEQKNARMFSSKEMKQITAKNYKKLPEVQKKLEENREKRIKTANRLLADIFNKNLQKNALKGNITLSTTASVIKLN